jgi:hypothetical protein
MIHFYAALVLTLGALIAAGFAVREELRWRRSVRMLEGASMNVPVSATAPNPVRLLVYLLASIIALVSPMPHSIFYKACIGFVLVLFLLMEVLLTVPGTPAILKTGTNIALYFVLWLGFSVTTGDSLWTWWGLVALVPIALGALYWWLIRARLGYLQISVIVYIVNATLVLCFAATLFATQFALWSLFGLLGAILFVGADAVRGWDSFRAPLRSSSMVQLLCLMAATLLLAWSTWGATLPALA